MARTLIICALVTAWAPACVGPKPPQQKEKVIQLTGQPIGAPKPALKYQLLPELREMNPGNPILGYLKCYGEQQNFFFNKTSVEDREKWLAAPLADLPVKVLHDYGRGPLTRADDAARLDSPD